MRVEPLDVNFGTSQLSQFPVCTSQLAQTTETYEKDKNYAGLTDFGRENPSDCTFQLSQFLTTKEVMELTGLSRSAIQAAVDQKRLERQRDVAKQGHRRNSQINLYPIESVFALWPRAKQAYEAQNQLTVYEKQEAATRQEALKEDLSLVAAMPDWKRQRVDARLVVLGYLDKLERELRDEALRSGQDIAIRDTAIAMLQVDARRGALPENIQAAVKLANARAGKSGARTLSRGTIYRWISKASEGISALAPSAKVFREPAWARPLLECWRKPQKPSLLHVVNYVLPSMLPPDISPPRYGAARRYLEKVGEVEKQRGRMLSREIKTIEGFTRRCTESLGAPLMAVIADGHTFDAEIAHPYSGKPFRPEIVVILDLYTRKIIGVFVGIAESAHVVMGAIRNAILSHGIFAIFYCDNGPGYKNAEINSLLDRIGIQIKHSRAYGSMARGVVERHFGSLWVPIAKGHQTYIGKPMDKQAKQLVYKVTRKETPGVLPTWEEFCESAEKCIKVYNAKPHRSLPKTTDDRGRRVHMSPDQKWQVAVDAGFEPELLQPEFLYELLPMDERQVSNCEINHKGRRYYSPALQEFHKTQVRMYRDPYNASRVWVTDLEGRYITEAKLDGNLRDYFSKSDVELAKEKREQGQERRVMNKLARNQEINLTGLPTLEMAERLDAALQEPPKKRALSLSEEQLNSLKADIEAKQARRKLEDPVQKYIRLTRLPAEQLTAADCEWMSDFELEPEGRAMKRALAKNQPKANTA